ncbi:MAG: phosphoglycerate kinase [Candidatus Micrarchaeota archaeon]
MKFKTLDDLPLEGKTVFCRLDLNCPVDEATRQPQLSARIRAHARTVLDLSSKGAKTVLLAHQGRKGEHDFISLAPHAELLESEVRRLQKKSAPPLSIRFVDDVAGQKAQSAIRSLANGEVLLLENVRFLNDETTFEKTGSSELVANLSPFCEVFVLDAFSCAHRAHASVVGFCRMPSGKPGPVPGVLAPAGRASAGPAACFPIPCMAGRVMEQELSALLSFHKPKRPVVFVLGGAKPADSLPILESWLSLKKLDWALCGGTLGNLMLLAAGREIGASLQFLKDERALEYLPQARALCGKYAKRLALPEDVVVDSNGSAKTLPISSLPSPFSILDIGPQTAARYADLIEHAGSIVMNGPMGVYEKDAFSHGTKVVLQAVEASRGFSLIGGGHTLAAIEKFHIDKKRLGYVSLSGKALIEYLSGDKLPGVEMLIESAKKARAE